MAKAMNMMRAGVKRSSKTKMACGGKTKSSKKRK